MAQCSMTIPDDLKETVENDAKNLTRSFSQQVVHILKEFYTVQADPSEVLNKKDDASN